MSKIVGDVLRPLGDAFTVPLLLALCLVAVIAATRAASSLWYLIENRGRRPLMIRMGAAKREPDIGAPHAALDDRLLAYLAADGQGGYVIAPGAGRPAAPRVMTEALEPSAGWPAALLRLALARERSYLVDVTWPEVRDTEAERKAVVRISRAPGDRVVASGSFTGKNAEDLVELVGCFCITFLRSQPRIRRHTPRWERWSQDINGYRAYRDGLEHQRRGMITRSIEDYGNALGRFDEAARVEPANLLVQLHRAALLELTHDYKKAVDIYSMSRALWPEHIETGYRLGNARKNAPGQVTHDELLEHLGNLRAQLKLRSLLTCWLRTLRPWRWNPGERHYWRSWLQLWLPGRVTKRATYLHAVAIGELVAELACLVDPRADCACGGETNKLMNRFAEEILRKARAPALVRLLHPEQRGKGHAGHDPAWHAEAANNVSWIAAYHGREHRGNIGWLALFNAACFFSQAIRLAPNQLPEGFSQPGGWADDCARAAIRELGILVRHPRHRLEPDWLANDPDLKPLRDSPTGQRWASFVGLPAQPAVTLASHYEPPGPRAEAPAGPTSPQEGSRGPGSLEPDGLDRPASVLGESTGTNAKQSPTAGESVLPISIYLADEHIHENVETAVDEWLAYAGLTVEERDEPVIGSWFRRMRARVGQAMHSPAATEAALTAVHIADSRLLLGQDATVTATLLQNLGPVIASLQPTKDAILRVGALLIVKADWVVHVFQLTAAQQAILDHKPQLASSPLEIIAALQLSGPNGAGVMPAAG